MNKVLRVLFLLLCVSLIASELSADEKVKIGVIAPLTGKGASRGESIRQGLELALEANKKSKNPIDVELIYRDVPIDKAKFVPALIAQLVDLSKVDAIIGPVGSTVALAAADMIHNKEVPTVIHTASTLKLSGKSPWIFRLWPTAKLYARSITKELTKRNIKKVVALSAHYDNCEDLLNELEDRAGDFSIIMQSALPIETTDFRPVLLKFSREKPDAIFLNLFEGQIGLAAAQAAELGISTALFTNAVMSDHEIELGGKSLNGIWYPSFSGFKESEGSKYIEKFGELPRHTDSSAAAHDALLVLIDGFKQAGKDKHKLRDYLRAGKFSGSSGAFHFDANQDSSLEVSLFEVNEGNIRIVNG